MCIGKIFGLVVVVTAFAAGAYYGEITSSAVPVITSTEGASYGGS